MGEVQWWRMLHLNLYGTAGSAPEGGGQAAGAPAVGPAAPHLSLQRLLPAPVARGSAGTVVHPPPLQHVQQCSSAGSSASGHSACAARGYKGSILRVVAALADAPMTLGSLPCRLMRYCVHRAVLKRLTPPRHHVCTD